MAEPRQADGANPKDSAGGLSILLVGFIMGFAFVAARAMTDSQPRPGGEAPYESAKNEASKRLPASSVNPHE